MKTIEKKISTRNQNQGAAIGALSCKRSSKRLENQRIKRQRIENDQDESTETKITDINLDCLEMIFMSLDLSNLLNVADSNKYLKFAAERTYARKYGKRDVKIENLSISEMRHLEVYQSIKTNDLKTSLQLIRCFGHLIKYLFVDIDPKMIPTVLSDRLFIHINEYCANTLHFISIEGYKTSMVFTKPFSSPKMIYLQDSCLGRNTFDWLFPNAHLLSYEVNGNFKDIVKHMPKLENLVIKISKEKLSKANKKTIETAFRTNPQLKRLKMQLSSEFDMEILSNACKHLQSLEKLKIETKFEEVIDLNVAERRLFLSIPTHLYANSEEFYNFLSKYSASLECLMFENFTSYVNRMDLKRFAQALPAVKEVNFYGKCSKNDANVCLTEFKSINTFTFPIENENEYNDLRIHFDNEWKILAKGFRSPGSVAHVNMQRKI